MAGGEEAAGLHEIGVGPPVERADAARNRAGILAAAQRLFARDGIANVSLDAIAAEAGVGKGTVFRRFKHKAGLAAALLGERERQLQRAILSGPAPLGPGAGARERLRAFVDAYLDFVESNLELLLLLETAHPQARYEAGSYVLWHRHVAILVGEIEPAWDAEVVAHALLAPLAAELYRQLRSDGMSPRRVRDGIEAVSARLTG